MSCTSVIMYGYHRTSSARNAASFIDAMSNRRGDHFEFTLLYKIESYSGANEIVNLQALNGSTIYKM